MLQTCVLYWHDSRNVLWSDDKNISESSGLVIAQYDTHISIAKHTTLDHVSRCY